MYFSTGFNIGRHTLSPLSVCEGLSMRCLQKSLHRCYASHVRKRDCTPALAPWMLSTSLTIWKRSSTEPVRAVNEERKTGSRMQDRLER